MVCSFQASSLTPVKGYKGYYVTPTGEVWSKKTHFANPQGAWKRLKLLTDRYGYYYIKIYPGRKGKLVHRLVAEAFIENLEKKLFVNHKDGNKFNNHKSNLEWCTEQENTHHAISLGLIDWDGVKKPINQYDKSGKFIRQFESITEAARLLGVGRSNIGTACRGSNHCQRKTAYGFRWRYA